MKWNIQEKNMAQYLKKKTFIKVMRGYSPEEVDAYIEYLLTKYNEISKENDDNKRKVAIALRKIQELSEKRPETVGKTQNDTVPDKAPSSSEAAKLLENARAEECRILEEAAKQAGKILRDAEEEARKKAEEITAEAEKSVGEAEAYVRAQYDAAQKLYTEVFSFRDKLFGMYNDHIEMLENIAEEANEYYDNVADAGVGLEDVLTEETAEGFSAGPLSLTAEGAPAESVTEKTPVYEPAGEELPDTDEASAESEDVGAGDDDIIPNDLLSDFPSSEGDEYEDSGEMAKYLSLMSDDTGLEDEEIDIRIDWKNRKSKAQNPEVLSSFAYDMAEEERNEQALSANGNGSADANKKSDFHDLDDLLANGGKSANDFSLTDEFDIVYSSRNSTKNVEEIVKQPLVAPEKPSNPKKHKIL